MSKLPIIDALRFEKLLISLGFKIVRQKEVMFFTAIPMEDIQQYHITREWTFQDR